MTNTTPRTRRQLRAALASEKSRRQTFEERAKCADSLAEALEADGWTPRYVPKGFIMRDIFTGQRTDPIVGWDAPDRAAAEALHALEVEKAKVDAEIRTRRETLEKVIEALEIKGYANGGTGTPDGGFVTHHNTDKFWSEIETTLAVRSAEQHAATQKKIAEKVSRLTKRAEGELIVDGAILPGRITINHGSIQADKLSANSHGQEKLRNLVVDGAVSVIPRDDVAPTKPKPKKKPAAKKPTKGASK